MATDRMLFHVDVIVVDGAPVAFEDGSGELEGAARWENTVVASASGDDFQTRKRVPTTFTFKLQFGPGQAPTDFSNMTDAQITGRDTVTGRRAMMPRCSFASMGKIGTGSVEVKFNVLSPVQWL